MIFSDECKIDVGTENIVLIWWKACVEWMQCCLSQSPTPEWSFMLWDWIFFNIVQYVGSMTVSGGYTIARKYIDIIYNYFHLLLPVIFQEIITFIKATMPPFT